MKRDQTKRGIDREYLRRCKQTTTEQRIEWLWMALDFVRGIEKTKPHRKEADRKEGNRR